MTHIPLTVVAAATEETITKPDEKVAVPPERQTAQAYPEVVTEPLPI